METICILVQEYNNTNMSDFVYCKVIKASSPIRSFPLRKAYISSFSTPLKYDTGYILEYCTKPSKCGKYTDHKVGAILDTLTKQEIRAMLLGF